MRGVPTRYIGFMYNKICVHLLNATRGLPSIIYFAFGYYIHVAEKQILFIISLKLNARRIFLRTGKLKILKKIYNLFGKRSLPHIFLYK